MRLPSDTEASDGWNWSRDPTRFSWWRVNPVLGVLVPLLALIGVLILLQMAGRPFASQAHLGSDAKLITVDRVQPRRYRMVDFSGTAPAYAQLEFGVNERVIANGYVFPNGRFRTQVY